MVRGVPKGVFYEMEPEISLDKLFGRHGRTGGGIGLQYFSPSFLRG